MHSERHAVVEAVRRPIPRLSRKPTRELLRARSTSRLNLREKVRRDCRKRSLVENAGLYIGSEGVAVRRVAVQTVSKPFVNQRFDFIRNEVDGTVAKHGVPATGVSRTEREFIGYTLRVGFGS